MSDAVPLLTDDLEPVFTSIQSPSKIRARITGNNNSFSNNEDADLHRVQRDASNQNLNNCCKRNVVRQKRPPKYAIAFIASTWGFLTNVERAIILPTMWLYFKTYWSDEVAKSFYGPTLAAFSLSILITTPLFGYAGHANVNVRYLLMFANLMEVIGNVAYLLPYSPWFVFFGRLIAGVGASCESPMYADLTRATDESERTPYIIVLLLSRQVGLIIGPAFTLILHQMTIEIGPVQISVYNGPGLVMAVLWVVHTLLIFFFYPHLDKFGQVVEDSRPGEATSSPTEATPKHSRQPSDSRIQAAFAGYGQYHIVTLCMEDRSLVLLGLFFLTVAYAFLSFVLHNILSMSKTLGATLVVVGVAIHVIGMPFPLAITESLYTKFIPPQQLDKAQTILRTIINVAFLLGPYVGGSLEGKPTIVFCTMMVLVALPFLMLLIRFNKFRVPREPSSPRADGSPKATKSTDPHLSAF
ncbi:unnamed protein product [Dibothriocephalus latus]|uniref:Major facilitator superfamily (MFS) profile domain-containing protein n=1 Tax=Dibothriocephalus latus TaxID=60516 RepID=A0A3P7MFN3_DIBLA|nr:unnamed protein product [Dibothriocephalus latus]